MKNFFAGFAFNARGVSYLARRPKLWIYLVIPFCLNALLIVGLLSAYAAYAAPLFTWLAGSLGGLDIADPQGFFSHIGDGLLWVARGLLKIIFFLLSIILIFITGFFVSGFINSPFYENLSEKILILEGAREDKGFSWTEFRRNLLYTMRVEAFKFMVFISLSLLLMLLSFIPVIGVFFGFMQILFTAWLAAFGLSTIPLALNRSGARVTVGWGMSNKLLLVGFGLPSLIPLAGVFLMGLQVPGATLLYLSTTNQEKK